jgi:hypothetical protein
MWSVLSTSIWQGSISQISLLHMARTYRVAHNINMSRTLCIPLHESENSW